MNGSLLARIRSLIAVALGCAAIAAALPAAADTLLFMRIDGVKGESAGKQPLGADAFRIVSFDVSVDDPGEPGGQRFSDVKFTLPLTAPVPQLFQLAVQAKAQPKASLVAVDSATGTPRFRLDLEDVVVQSLSMQTLGNRDAAVGTLRYKRSTFRSGDGKSAVSTSWERTP